MKVLLEEYKKSLKISEKVNDIKPVNKIAILLDVSGSTGCEFSSTPSAQNYYYSYHGPNSVLQKEISVAKDVAFQNKDGVTLLYTFSNLSNFVGPIKVTPGSGTVMFPPNLRSDGGTNTYFGLERIFNDLSTTKIEHIILITDGETNSTPALLLSIYEKLRSKNVTLKIIAVSAKDQDFDKLSVQEESKLPGLDVVNILSTEAVIYTPRLGNTPYVMATKSSDSALNWSLLGVTFPKTIPFPDLFNGIIGLLKNSNWNFDDSDLQVLFIELGMYLAIFYVIFPSDLINSIMSPVLIKGCNSDLIEYIKYGFELKRQDKPLIKINLSLKIITWKDRHDSYADAENILQLKGSALNEESISFGNGVVCFRSNPNDLIKNINFSEDEYGNVFFAFGGTEQPIRQVLRDYFGKKFGIRNAQSSPSAVFYVANYIVLLLLVDFTLTLDHQHIRKLRNLAKIQAKMLRMCGRGQYGNSFLEDWGKGVIPTTHYTETKTHLDLHTDYDVNSLLLPQTLWWATMMAIFGEEYFKANESIYKPFFDDNQINFSTSSLFEYLRKNYNNLVTGKVKISEVNKKQSIITMYDFEEGEQIFLLKDHEKQDGTQCTAQTHYSVIEKNMMQNKCVWCHQTLPESFYEVLTFPTKEDLTNDNPPKFLTVRPNQPIETNNIRINHNSRPQRGHNNYRNNGGQQGHQRNTVSTTPPKNCFLILLQGTVGSGKTTFADAARVNLESKGYKVFVEGVDKYCKSGMQIKDAVKCVTKTFRTLPRENVVVIIDTCGDRDGEGADKMTYFQYSFSGFTSYKIQPNFDQNQIEEYLSWSLYNVLHRKKSNQNTNYWLNPDSVGAEKCKEIHTNKAKSMLGNNFIEITVEKEKSKIIKDIEGRAKTYEDFLVKNKTIKNQVQELSNKIPTV